MFEIVEVFLIQLVNWLPFIIGLYFLFGMMSALLFRK